MTSRICAALRGITILGHPSGRLFLQRDEQRVDYGRVFAAAAVEKVALELNANPRRLDLDWTLHQTAVKQGVLLALGADAHDLGSLTDLSFGVSTARKGMLSQESLVSCWLPEQIKRYFAERKAAIRE